MIRYAIVCFASLSVAALTLFSGFGLGTLLMPVFALFFPVEIAVAATAVVHLANNLFKLALLGKWANYSVVVRFALPAALSAFVGARTLIWLADIPPLVAYEFMGRLCEITVVKLAVALLLIAFALFEIVPQFKRFAFEPKYIPVGGMLSGFFGGLSGHQGALRSAFLIRTGLEKEAFLGTVVVSAVVVDVSRLSVYLWEFLARGARAASLTGIDRLVLAAIVAAFLGSYLGSKLIHKVTMQAIQNLVTVMLLLIAAALGGGII